MSLTSTAKGAAAGAGDDDEDDDEEEDDDDDATAAAISFDADIWWTAKALRSALKSFGTGYFYHHQMEGNARGEGGEGGRKREFWKV